MKKTYSRAHFLRSGGKLRIKHKVELVGEPEIVERKKSKHKRRKERRDAESALCQEGT